jgi:phage gp16-like protein
MNINRKVEKKLGWYFVKNIKGIQMTQVQKDYKKQLIQKIQVNKHNVFFDDEERREFILSRFGVDSTTKLSIDQLKLLLDFCTKKVSDIPMVNMATQPQIKKIRDLWQEKAGDKGIHALLNFQYKITKKNIRNFMELTKQEATKVIVALDNM